MTPESTPPLFHKLGRVFAVRKWASTDENRPSTIAILVSRSQPMLRIASPYIDAAARIPLANHSRNDLLGSRTRDHATAVLPIVSALVKPIPIAGPGLEAAANSLLEILKIADRATQNRQSVQDLKKKLHQLVNHLSLVPGTNRQNIRALRDNLTQQLNEALTLLKSLENNHSIRYSTISPIISQCHKDVEFYLQTYTVLSNMYTENSVHDIKNMLETFVNATPQVPRSRMTGITLVDATGKEYQVSIDSAVSYERFTKTMALFFDGKTMEGQIQRRYMEGGMYDLCIDEGRQIVPINEGQDWSRIQPGTRVVMRVILVQRPRTTRRYQCPRCKMWNSADDHQRIDSPVDCRGCDGRFQISEADTNKYRLKGEQDGGAEYARPTISRDSEMLLLRNFHLKQLTTISAELIELRQSTQLLWKDTITARARRETQQGTINLTIASLAGIFANHNATSDQHKELTALAAGDTIDIDIRDLGSAPVVNSITSQGEFLDIHSIVRDTTAIHGPQTITSEDLNELKQSNQLLWQTAITVRARDQKQQEIINRILKFLSGVFANYTTNIGHHKEDVADKTQPEHLRSVTEPDLIQRKKQAALHTDVCASSPTPGTKSNISQGELLDMHTVLRDITITNSHQETIPAEFSELKQPNQKLWQDAMTARARHAKQQDTINRILKFLAGVFGARTPNDHRHLVASSFPSPSSNHAIVDNPVTLPPLGLDQHRQTEDVDNDVNTMNHHIAS